MAVLTVWLLAHRHFAFVVHTDLLGLRVEHLVTIVRGGHGIALPTAVERVEIWGSFVIFGGWLGLL